MTIHLRPVAISGKIEIRYPSHDAMMTEIVSEREVREACPVWEAQGFRVVFHQ